jgi:hypothetical protein
MDLVKGAAVVHELLSRSLFEKEAEVIRRLAELRGWTVFTIEYPIIDLGFSGEGRPDLRVRMACDNWNELPPSVQLLSLEGSFLSSLPKGPSGIFNNGAHPVTGRPFICMRGIREYHVHPSHTGDAWENYKGKEENSLAGILTQIWHAWRKSRI